MTFDVLRERPTAVLGTRDVSGSPGRASAAAEARRPFEGHPVREDCVCRGPAIVAVTFLPHDIVEAVRRHQIEPVHIAWDLAHGHDLALWQRVAGGQY